MGLESFTAPVTELRRRGGEGVGRHAGGTGHKAREKDGWRQR